MQYYRREGFPDNRDLAKNFGFFRLCGRPFDPSRFNDCQPAGHGGQLTVSKRLITGRANELKAISGALMRVNGVLGLEKTCSQPPTQKE